MRRRAFVLLFGTLALSGCGDSGSYRAPGSQSPGQFGQPLINQAPQGRSVAILLPLTGPRSEIGQAMLQAAQLALPGPDSPTLDPRDTGGTPAGAAAAAQAAIAQGAGLILGPLTSAETAAVAPVARTAGVAVLAFTNDSAQAQPGVWTLGVTPGQQVRRLVAAAQAQGKSQFAALLPDTDFGRAMGTALTQTAAANGLPTPTIRLHGTGMPAITSATRDISGYATRRGPIDTKIKAARALGTADGRREAQELAKTPIPPPPFDTLLLGDTRDELAEIAAVLPYYDVDRGSVQIIGPALWALPGSGATEVRGAWFAAPDPASRSSFEQAYTARYNAPPAPIADIAFDAASIARVLGGRLGAQTGYSVAALTQPAGFTGVDGWLELLPDGQVRRGLAVFRVERGGPQLIEPAPDGASVPGS